MNSFQSFNGAAVSSCVKQKVPNKGGTLKLIGTTTYACQIARNLNNGRIIFGGNPSTGLVEYDLATDISYNFTPIYSNAYGMYGLCTDASNNLWHADINQHMYNYIYNSDMNYTSIDKGIFNSDTGLFYYNGYVYICGGAAYDAGEVRHNIFRFPVSMNRFSAYGFFNNPPLEVLSIPLPPNISGFFSLQAICVDSNGLYYIADAGHAIYQTDLVTTTIYVGGGKGNGPYLGDGFYAKDCTINSRIWSMCMDASNNLYFSDQYSNVIRRVDYQTKIITTVAGNGSPNTSTDPTSHIGQNSLNVSMSPVYIAYDNPTNQLIVSEGAGNGFVWAIQL
jgi:hypothetical protein